MSNKSHIFQVWERYRFGDCTGDPKGKIIATFDSKAEAEQFVILQRLHKNDDICYCDDDEDYTYTIKRIHKNKVK